MVSRAIAGDCRAMDALWREHRAWVGAVVLAHLPREVELEDALQEVALAMVRSIRTVHEPEAFCAWLREIARRTAQTSGRRVASERKRRKFSLVGARSEPVDQERIEALRSMIQGLSEEHREVLLLQAQGLSVRTIGEIIQVPERTAETRLRRARRVLRENAQLLNRDAMGEVLR